MQNFCFCQLSMQILWRRRYGRVVDLKLPNVWGHFECLRVLLFLIKELLKAKVRKEDPAKKRILPRARQAKVYGSKFLLCRHDTSWAKESKVHPRSDQGSCPPPALIATSNLAPRSICRLWAWLACKRLRGAGVWTSPLQKSSVYRCPLFKLHRRWLTSLFSMQMTFKIWWTQTSATTVPTCGLQHLRWAGFTGKGLNSKLNGSSRPRKQRTGCAGSSVRAGSYPRTWRRLRGKHFFYSREKCTVRIAWKPEDVTCAYL